MKSSRWLYFMSMLAALSIAACNSASSDASTVPGTTSTAVTVNAGAQLDFVPDTAWEEVLARLDDGVDLQTAIDAFSVAFAPIPGAQISELEPGFEGSGTGPLRWLLASWDELDAEQQNAVGLIMEGWSLPGPEATRTVDGLDVFAAAAPAQALVDDMVTNLEVLLGRSLTMTVAANVAANPAAIQGNLAVTAGYNSSGGQSGDAVTCEIVFNPDSLNLPQDELVALAAHETFHCFDWDLGLLEESKKRPPWVVEGLAEWAGETVAGGSPLSADKWELWLVSRAAADLFDRAYDAIGFYSHLTDTGVDVWSRIDVALLASGDSSEVAYQSLVEPASLDTIDSWGSGYYRDPGQAPLWDQDGPGITPDKAPIGSAPLVNESTFPITAAPHTIYAVDADVAAEVVTFDSPGNGMALLSDGSEHRLADLHGHVFCTIGTCTCPEGTPNAGTAFEPMEPGTMRLAPTGHTTGSEVTLLGWSLDRYCNNERCHVGTWESVAWHNLPRILGGGSDISMVIDVDGEGFIDFRSAQPLLGFAFAGRFEEVLTVPVKIELGGTSRFTVEAKGPLVQIVAATGGMTMQAFTDLGDGYFETGAGIPVGAGNMSPAASVWCAGDTLAINKAIEFRRISTEAELPPEAQDMTPTTGSADVPQVTLGTLPEIDPCTLLSLGELQELFPDAAASTGPEEVGALAQCAFGFAVSVGIQPPLPPGLYGQGGEEFGITLLDIPGVGDWAVAQINEPNPAFGTEATVLTVAAGNELGTVVIVPFIDIFPDTPEYDALIELLELALSRL
jgi:hypothetical protein